MNRIFKAYVALIESYQVVYQKKKEREMLELYKKLERYHDYYESKINQ